MTCVCIFAHELSTMNKISAPYLAYKWPKNKKLGQNKQPNKTRITRICQVEYRDLLVELIGFSSQITKICQTELLGFADWIGHVLPGITVAFTKTKKEGQRQYQQITILKQY